MNYLESEPERLDLEHVHFNRQCDFIELEGERIVRDVFAVDRMDDIAHVIANATGVDIGKERQNRTTEMTFKSLRPLQRMLRSPYSRLVSAEVREDIRERMTRVGFYKDVPKRQFVQPGSAIDLFIREYYAHDFALHKESAATSIYADA